MQEAMVGSHLYSREKMKSGICKGIIDTRLRSNINTIYSWTSNCPFPFKLNTVRHYVYLTRGETDFGFSGTRRTGRIYHHDRIYGGKEGVGEERDSILLLK